MCDYIISPKVYTKMIFHAAKYPHCAVNGILLTDKNSPQQSSESGGSGKVIHIIDAIPLFHQCLYVTPMSEIALAQVEAMAAENDLQIAGYYAAAENFYDCSIEKAPAFKIADKISETFPNSCFVMIDNRFVTLSQEKAAIKLWQNLDGKWTRGSFILDNANTTLEAVSELLQRGAMKDICDFDNHLDNPENDWTNGYLDKDLKQIMAMY